MWTDAQIEAWIMRQNTALDRQDGRGNENAESTKMFFQGNEKQKALAQKVLDAYAGGSPVVILTERGVLHGMETLQAIIQTGAGLKCAVFLVDQNEFESCDLPEFCEGLRQNWLNLERE